MRKCPECELVLSKGKCPECGWRPKKGQLAEPKPPTLHPWMDQCQFIGPYGRCLLRATREGWIDRDDVTHYKWCSWHGICLSLHYHGNDFEEFDRWVGSLSRNAWYRKYTPNSIFDLCQGKLRQPEWVEGYGSEDKDPGRMLPPHENQRRLRELIENTVRGMSVKEEEVPF